MAWLREKTKKERVITGIKYGFCVIPLGGLYLAFLYAQTTSVALESSVTNPPAWFYLFLAGALVIFFTAGFVMGYSGTQTPE